MLNGVSLTNKIYEMKVLPKRIDKTIQWLENSRDSWKDKCLRAKNQLKKTTLAMKRARKGRGRWRQKVQSFKELVIGKETELSKKDAENKRLKKEIDEARKEIELLKKKASL